MNRTRREHTGDAVAWNRFLEGDLDAFDTLYRSYYDVLFRYGLGLTQDPQRTEDGIQEFFLYLWTHRSGLSDVSSVKFYLLKSYRRRLFEQIGKDRARSDRELRYADDEPISSLPHEAFLIRYDAWSSRHARLRRMMESITPRQREIVHLKYYENLSYTEIAELLSINYQTAVSHVSEAMRSLRRSREEAPASA